MDVNTPKAIQEAKKSIKSEFDNNENVKISSRTDFKAKVYVKNLGWFVFTVDCENLKEDSKSIPMDVDKCDSNTSKRFLIPLTEYQEKGYPTGEIAFYERYAKRFIEQENQ